MDVSADFIIVGGGTSGLLLANCLASTPSKPTVLVIEAGPEHSALSYRNPSQRYLLPFTNPELNYRYITLPQTGLANRVIPYPRGKGLGGTTLINFMIYLSGAKDDYDYWAELVEDDAWKWENCHRRFKELETFNGKVPSEYRHIASPSYKGHGYSGPLEVGLPQAWELRAKEIIEEAVIYGIPANLDMNSGNPLGIGMSPVAAANGYRTTSASANLKKKLDHLEIWTNATVKRVIVKGKRATGVELIDGRKVFAKYEVVLTAGSFASPKILMLSGIGPRDELTKHGIDVIKHLPGIGQTMKDHTAIFLTALMKPEFAERRVFEANPKAVAAATSQWNKDGTGEFAKQMQSLAIMFNKIPEMYKTPEFLDLPVEQQEYIQRETIPTYECSFGGPKFPPTIEVPVGSEYLGITIFGMNPQSSGNIRLASTDVNDAPIIDSQILMHPFDRRVMIESLIDALKVFKSTQTYKQGFVSWLTGPKSDDDRIEIERFIEEESIVVWHANGTAKMGKKEDEDEGICVDSDFKVLGIQGLRVADMSVSPVTINGHTQAAAYLIGATAAEKLIAEYKL